ncbi:MAG: TIGR04283 family arsenosugar biosynthesis glycosyltransferase [Parvularculaceae bacterium]
MMAGDQQISVVIPTLNAKAGLGSALACLEAARDQGLVREIIIADGGSSDTTEKIAGSAGARIVKCDRGRGLQLATGAACAVSDWLLFVHADTWLDGEWEMQAKAHIADGKDKVGVFRLRFSSRGLAPRIVAAGAMIRTWLLKTPYGDQGLLISRKLYDEIGGYKPMRLFEDVEFIDRITRQNGRNAIRVLSADAVTSASKYQQDGYVTRVFKNFRCLMMYRFGRSIEDIEQAYQ